MGRRDNVSEMFVEAQNQDPPVLPWPRGRANVSPCLTRDKSHAVQDQGGETVPTGRAMIVGWWAVSAGSAQPLDAFLISATSLDDPQHEWENAAKRVHEHSYFDAAFTLFVHWSVLQRLLSSLLTGCFLQIVVFFPQSQ